jgi:hypothetical protein
MATASTTPSVESAASMIGHINFDTNPTGKRSAGNPPATFDEAGTGDVAWLRCGGTRRRKSEQQRTQTSTYTGAPVLDPTDEGLSIAELARAHDRTPAGIHARLARHGRVQGQGPQWRGRAANAIRDERSET